MNKSEASRAINYQSGKLSSDQRMKRCERQWSGNRLYLLSVREPRET